MCQVSGAGRPVRRHPRDFSRAPATLLSLLPLLPTPYSLLPTPCTCPPRYHSGVATIVITGGSRGIGAATARLAAERGYQVCVNFRSNRAAAESVVAEIEAAGGRAIAVRADVSVETDVVRLFETVDATLGRVTALVNNAGILERQTRVDAMDADRITRVLATNVTGAFICAREAVRRMSTHRGDGGGAIVNVSSRAAQLGAPGEYVDYAASKAALDALTIGLAREVAGEGIRVNGVRAGIIYTEIHASGGEPGRVDRIGPTLPMRRGGDAIEVARAILWLLSDEASYSTGTFIDVAGGR
jgi:NAD(P)-dependent dehydrogenase (short-subunit alcohol dehydrogenase family)